jgi:hypothetical protein
MRLFGLLVVVPMLAAGLLSAGCGKSPEPAPAPAASVASAQVAQDAPATAAPAAPTLPHRIVKKNDDGSLEVEITVIKQVPETRTVEGVDDKGKTVLVTQTTMMPIKSTKIIVVPAGEDLARFLSDQPKELGQTGFNTSGGDFPRDSAPAPPPASAPEGAAPPPPPQN